MQGALGEKIGEGATADIHAWAPGQAVKLFKAGASLRAGRHEARMTRAAFAAGLPAPEVFDEVIVEGRFGIVLPRLDGPTLMQRVRAGTSTPEQAGVILAGLYLSVHKTPPPDAPSLRDWFHALSQVPGGIPTDIAAGVLILIERLPTGDGLCHGDLHTNNVIMTADGPKIIDWVSTTRAPAAYDMGRCHLILSELVYAPDDLDPELPRALYRATLHEYARLAGTSPAALTAAMEPYLPIVRAFALTDQIIKPARRDELIQRIEASLHTMND